MATTKTKVENLQSPKKILSKADIFSAQDCTIKDVDMPQWGGFIRIKKMSLLEQISLSEVLAKSASGKTDENADVMVDFIIASVVDEAGNLIFTREDAQNIKKRSAVSIVKLFEAIQKFNSVEIGVEESTGN